MGRKSHYSGFFYLSIALLFFFIVGLAISCSIRACVNHHVSNRVQGHDIIPHDTTNLESENKSYNEPMYVMPDSVIRICKPSPLENISEMILQKTAYIVSYNKDTRLPNWVAWNLTEEHVDGPYKRLGSFYEDEDVPLKRATNEDYRGSKWSRGHMCPAGDNKWDRRAMFDTFSLINVCPQNAKLNSGLWNSIEMNCRNWARKFGGVFIICGPIFLTGEHEKIGNNNVYVPEAFFKVILCLNGKPKGIGFIVRNADGTRKRDLFYNSIDQVERVTGMDFFPALPDEIEDAVEATADINEWN